MLAKFSVKKPYTVFVCVILVIILGFVSFANMTPDLLPNLDFPYVLIMTTYPGASPEEVEEIVTKPVEEAMATLDNLKDINSVSNENYSIVMLEFTDSANMDTVTIDVREELDQLSGDWDEMIGTPYIMKINPNMLPVTVTAVNMEGLDNAALTDLLNNGLLADLEGIEGVAAVSVSGDVQKQVSIVLNQDKIDAVNEKIKNAVLSQYGSARTQILSAIDSAVNGQSQLVAGQSALQNTYTQMLDQFDTAREGLYNTQDTLYDTQMTLAQSRAQTAAQIDAAAQLKEELQTLQSAYMAQTTALNTLTARHTQLVQLQTDISTLRTNEEALISTAMSTQSMTRNEAVAYLSAHSAQYGQIQSDLSEKNDQLSALGVTEAALSDAIAQTQSDIDQTNTSIAALETSMLLKNLTSAQLPQAISDTDAALTALYQLLSQTDSMIAQTGNSQMSVNDALQLIDRQQAEATFQLYTTLADLISSDKTLALTISDMDSTLAEIDSAQQQTLDSLDLYNVLTLDNLSNMISAQNFSMPAGYITDNGTDYLVRVGDQFTDVSQVENMVLLDMGITGIDPILLSDVADVSLTDNSDQLYAKVGNNDGVLLSFTKQSTYATATVSDNIQNALKALEEKYPGLAFTNMMDQGVYIHLVINSVLQNLFIGAILAIAILYLFLRDIRPTFIIACSIPISVTFAIVMMYFSHVTLNIISLAGLAIGIGMLVDNSIVVIENIYRLRSLGVPVYKAAVSGAAQVAGAITASTLTTVCVFAPIVFVQGITRQLFTDMALTVAYSLLASLIVALTLVPAIASGVLRKTNEKESKIFNKILCIYEKGSKHSLKKKKLILIASAALLVVSVVLTVARGFTFMPEMASTEISMELQMPENATLEQTAAMSDEIIARIMKIEGVETVGAMLSGGLASTVGLSYIISDASSVTMYVILKDGYASKSAEIGEAITAALSDLNCDVTINASSSMMDFSSAFGESGVGINVYANDLDTLQQAAGEIAAIVGGVEGVVGVSDGMEDTTPVINITVDKDKAMAQGLTVAQVYLAMSEAMTSSATATTLSVKNGTYDITITDPEAASLSVDDIGNFVFTATNMLGEETQVNINDIATITRGQSLNAINRSDQRRYLTVSGTLADGYNVTKVTAAVKNALKNYTPPEGVTVEFSGENETIMSSLSDLAKMLALGIVIVYLIMVAQFQSLLSPFIVMFTIPLAFTGGLLALFLTGFEISVVAMIGFVLLVGIIVNNGIVLIDYINRLRLEGTEKTEAIVSAGLTRLRPVIMTAVTTILGLLPMALGIGLGADLMQPVAVVCIGGLIYATFMTLFIVPILYDELMKKELRVVTKDDLTIADI